MPKKIPAPKAFDNAIAPLMTPMQMDAQTCAGAVQAPEQERIHQLQAALDAITHEGFKGRRADVGLARQVEGNFRGGGFAYQQGNRQEPEAFADPLLRSVWQVGTREAILRRHTA